MQDLLRTLVEWSEIPSVTRGDGVYGDALGLQESSELSPLLAYFPGAHAGARHLDATLSYRCLRHPRYLPISAGVRLTAFVVPLCQVLRQ
jgi:hypothetical protein